MEQKFKYTEIFTLIPQFLKEGLITEDEKRIIKENIIKNNPDLTLEMNQYAEDHDKRKLVDNLKVMFDITKMSSPVDNDLFRRKRTHRRTKMEEEKKGHAKNFQGLGVQFCDYGQSPVINTKTPVFNK